MTEEEKYEQIEHYLADDLSEAEKERFEQLLKTDAKLMEELELHRHISIAIGSPEEKEIENLRAKIEVVFDNSEDKKLPVRSKKSTRSIVATVVAFVLVVGLLLFFLFLPKEVPAPSTQAYLVDQLPNANDLRIDLTEVGSRGDDSLPTDMGNDVFSSYLDYYNQKNFEAALEELKVLPEQNRNKNYNYLLGIAYLQLGELENAQNTLAEVSYPFEEEANWYIALIKLQQEGYTEEVKMQLEQIRENSNVQIATQASKILNEWQSID